MTKTKTAVKTNIADLVQKIIDSNDRQFMKVKALVNAMDESVRRELKIKKNTPLKNVRKILEPFLEDRFLFRKGGNTLFISIPCDPAEIVLAEISRSKTTTPKMIAKFMPFTKKDTAAVLSELSEKGLIKVLFDENLNVKISLADISKNKTVKFSEYTPEKFKKAFDALEQGRIFVRIYELRKKLAWPREVFDKMLIDLRNKEIIQLHMGDASRMTSEQTKDCFVDENGFRMGSVTWNVR